MSMIRPNKWIEAYFSGTYFHFLDKENRKKLEYHWYFAASAVFMIVAYNLMFIAGLVVSLGYGEHVLASKLYATLILLTILSTCWAYFIRANRYREIVGRWVPQRKLVRRFAMTINWSLLAGFAIMAIWLVVST